MKKNLVEKVKLVDTSMKGKKESKTQIGMKKSNILLIEGRRPWHPTPVLLPGKSHGQEAGRLQSMGSQEST